MKKLMLSKLKGNRAILALMLIFFVFFVLYTVIVFQGRAKSLDAQYETVLYRTSDSTITLHEFTDSVYFTDFDTLLSINLDTLSGQFKYYRLVGTNTGRMEVTVISYVKDSLKVELIE